MSKRFFVGSGVKIITLHIFYFVMFVILSVLFWGAGHGSAVPFVVFFAPFVTSFFESEDVNFFSAMLLLQMPIYCGVWWIFYAKNIRKEYLLALPVFHFCMAVVAIFFSTVSLSDRYYYWFFVSVLIMLFYWRKYFVLFNPNQPQKLQITERIK